MTADLITWHRAQLAVVERVARAAGGDQWRYGDSGLYHEDAARRPGPFAVGPYGYLDEEEGEHIALHDPARELAEVRAKRLRLDAYEAALAEYEPDGPTWDHDSEIGRERTRTLEWVVRTDALPYADREGYQERWRP